MKKILSLLALSMVFFSVSLAGLATTPVVKKFNDVQPGYMLDADGKPVGTKYYDAIVFLYAEDVVNGYGDGTYKPDNSINRAEFLKIVVEAFYSTEFESYGEVSCFTDVKAKEWFTKYICFAKEQGIVNGYADNTFKPANTINLVEALKITLKVFGYEYAESDPWYKGLVEKAAAKNFIPQDFTAFAQLVNRGQMADLVSRIIKEGRGELKEFLGDRVAMVVSYETLAKGLNVEEGIDTSSLLSKVCAPAGEDPAKSVSCLASKKAIYGCEYAQNVSYGDNEFVRCNKTKVGGEAVLVVTGGLNQNGYNLLGEKEDQGIITIRDLDDLLEFWGEVKSGEDARELVKAYTGHKDFYTSKELKATYGEKIKFLVPEDDIAYSSVSMTDDGYKFALYFKDVFGCSPFYIHEVVYLKSSNGVKELEETLIADAAIDGLCVD